MSESDRMSETLPRSMRLFHDRDFARVIRSRHSTAGQSLVIYAAPNGSDFSRLGLSVSRRLGSAVVRNRLKRLVREAFRRSRAELPAGWDWVVLPKLPKKVKGKPTPPPPSNWNFAQIEDEFRQLARRLSRVSR